MLHHPQVVGDEEIREAKLLLQLGEQVQHLRLDRHVECRYRLVEHQQLWVENEGASDADALTLTAGELMRVAARTLWAQPNHVEHLRYLCLALRTAPQAVNAQPLTDRVGHR